MEGEIEFCLSSMSDYSQILLEKRDNSGHGQKFFFNFLESYNRDQPNYKENKTEN